MTAYSDDPWQGEQTAYERSWLAGAQLGKALARGWRPAPQPAPIVLARGEMVFAQTTVQVWQFTGQDVTYDQAWFVGFGNPLLLGASLLGSVAYNSYKRNQAMARAAAQWRPTAQGHLYLTSSRLAFALSTGWNDVYYPYLRATSVDPTGIIIALDGQPMTKLQVWPPHWFFVLLRFVAFGEILDVEIPEYLMNRGDGPRELGPGRAGTTGDSGVRPPPQSKTDDPWRPPPS